MGTIMKTHKIRHSITCGVLLMTYLLLGFGSLVIPVHVSQVGHDWSEPTYVWASDNST